MSGTRHPVDPRPVRCPVGLWPFVVVPAILGAALVTCASLAIAQPRFESASPTAGGTTSQQANTTADKTVYQAIEYQNKNKKGPMLVVIPGEIKSSNATFLQKFSANNIADFGELELSNANFQVLERSNLGPVLKEFELAYNLGDPQAARKYLGMGKLKSTKYIVKFDILKTEQVASAQQSFDGRTLGQMAGLLGAFSGSLGGARAGAAGGTAPGSAHRGAETTEQLAQGYTEEKMEVGATSGGALGVNSAQQGGAGLDTMVQRLVQKSVWDIDSKYK